MLKGIYLASFCCSFFCIFISFFVTEADMNCYKHYVIEKMDAQKKEYIFQQQRKKICKDIWYTEKDKSGHCNIQSDASTFSFNLSSHKAEEKLHNTRCFYQEVEDRKTTTRYFTSNEGVYCFPPHQFISNEVTISFLENNPSNFLSKDMDLTSFLQAKAKRVIFQFSPQSAEFKAEHLKAIVPSNIKEKIKDAKS
jgi:hypothetical protein